MAGSKVLRGLVTSWFDRGGGVTESGLVDGGEENKGIMYGREFFSLR